MIGPIMIGPSSSHTAGAVRLGQMGRLILGDKPVKAKIYLHGSFKDTYLGHGTDRAIIAGLMGYCTDDPRIRRSLEFAAADKVIYEFIPANLGDVHPNTVKLELASERGHQINMMGCSIGGGAILLTEVNDYKVHLTGQYSSLVVPHLDRPGFVAKVAHILTDNAINIAKMQVTRRNKGKNALMVIETDQKVSSYIVKKCNNIPGIQGCFALAPL